MYVNTFRIQSRCHPTENNAGGAGGGEGRVEALPKASTQAAAPEGKQGLRIKGHRYMVQAIPWKPVLSMFCYRWEARHGGHH